MAPGTRDYKELGVHIRNIKLEEREEADRALPPVEWDAPEFRHDGLEVRV